MKKKEVIYTRVESDVARSIEQMAQNLGLSKSATVNLLIKAALGLSPERIITLASHTQGNS